MVSSNDERENIQKLNEHNPTPMKLIGGSMKVFNTDFHTSKPNWSSNSSRDRVSVPFNDWEMVKLFMTVVKVKFYMVLKSLKLEEKNFNFFVIFFVIHT